MAKRKKQVDSEVYKREELYKLELKRKRMMNYVGYSVVGVLTLLMFMIFSGTFFDPFLRKFGLKAISNKQQGVYTDCSLPENKGQRYCQPTESESNKEWKDLGQPGKGAKFQLYSNN